MSLGEFVQVAILAAYYKIYGCIVNAYESVLTKLFKIGRTEVARSASLEAKQFIQAFVKNRQIKKELMDNQEKHSSSFQQENERKK